MDTYLLIPAVLLLAGLIPISAYRKKTNVPGSVILLGAAAWFFSVALKSAFAYFFNTPINIFLVSIYIPLYYVYVGLLTGVFEIFVPLLIILKYKRRFEAVNHQIGFGIGFGSFEAIAVGITTLVSFLAVRYFPAQIPPQLLESLSQSLAGTTSEFLVRALTGGVERLSATAVHVFCAFMLFMFVYHKRKIYLLVPVLLKTFTDGLALYFSAASFSSLYYEVFYFALGLVCIMIMLKVMKSNNLKLNYEQEAAENRAQSKKFYLSKLKAAGFIFALVGWFLLFAVLFESRFETQFSEIEKFVDSNVFQWGLKIFVLSLLVVLVKWQKRIDETIQRHKWLRVMKNVIVSVGAIGWIIGLGSLVFK
ncbi:MAG: YhfC family glutamic-type intramembrane protease [Desulfotomaculaceae bacterium]|nr:YhfC family glutamic-type intramembrane protease [Desulfotomaculaceae bacterium]